MKYLFSNHGFYSTNCDDDYVAKEGEVVFDFWPVEPDLLAAFPGRLDYMAWLEKERVALGVRNERDKKLREIYDAGTQMIRRELETLPLDPVYEAQLIAKRSELHNYARLLQAIPDQAGFPEVVEWPEPPTEELS